MPPVPCVTTVTISLVSTGPSNSALKAASPDVTHARRRLDKNDVRRRPQHVRVVDHQTLDSCKAPSMSPLPSTLSIRKLPNGCPPAAIHIVGCSSTRRVCVSRGR